MASTRPSAPASERRAPAANQGPQRKPSERSGTSDATAAPARPRRCASSPAKRRWPAAATAAYEPNAWSASPPGATTSTRGGGRSPREAASGDASAIADEAVQLLQVHEVVDADEEQPLPAAQPPDEWMVERRALRLVALDLRRRLAQRSPALVEERQQLLARRVRSAGDRRTHRRRALRRPLPGGGHRGPRGEEPTRGRGVGERLRHVPVFLPAGRSQKLIGERSE